MSWVFLGALVLIGILWLVYALRNMDRRLVMRGLRWIVGGGAGLTETLYMELRQGGSPVNPMDWFAAQ